MSYIDFLNELTGIYSEPANQDIYIDEQDFCDCVLPELRKIEAKVISMRFGLCGYERHTYNKIADELGVSISKVRFSKDLALRKLRNPSSRIRRDNIRNDELEIKRAKKILELAGYRVEFIG